MHTNDTPQTRSTYYCVACYIATQMDSRKRIFRIEFVLVPYNTVVIIKFITRRSITAGAGNREMGCRIRHFGGSSSLETHTRRRRRRRPVYASITYTCTFATYRVHTDAV